MADPKQLEILKSGIKNWNEFREENPDININLSNSDLTGYDLHSIDVDCDDIYALNSSLGMSGVTDFQEAYKYYGIIQVDLRDANLSNSKLDRVIFHWSFLSKANLNSASIEFADFSMADLKEANLSKSKLSYTNFRDTNLVRADLRGANLVGTMFIDSSLQEVLMDNNTALSRTIFSNVNLSGIKGLDKCRFYDKCYIDYFTLKCSGNLPINFLRGCGLSDTFIDHFPALFKQAIQFYSCFISYSSKDEEIAKKIHADLQDKGIRCWFAPEDLKIGDKFRSTIHEAIKVYDKLLLIISENSINSHWVEDEVEKAFEKERKQNRTVLFPITVDQNIFDIDAGWVDSIKNTRHIGDFINWKNHDSYKKAFDRLVRDLKQESTIKKIEREQNT